MTAIEFWELSATIALIVGTIVGLRAAKKERGEREGQKRRASDEVASSTPR